MDWRKVLSASDVWGIQSMAYSGASGGAAFAAKLDAPRDGCVLRFRSVSVASRVGVSNGQTD